MVCRLRMEGRPAEGPVAPATIPWRARRADGARVVALVLLPPGVSGRSQTGRSQTGRYRNVIKYATRSWIWRMYRTRPYSWYITPAGNPSTT